MDGKARTMAKPRAFPPTNRGHGLDMSHLWRSRKYECVWLHAWGTGSQAKAGVGRWITFTNHLRPPAIRREMGRPDQFQVRLKQDGQPPAVASFDILKRAIAESWGRGDWVAYQGVVDAPRFSRSKGYAR